MLFYLAIHKDKESVYGVTVPSLAGCFSYGNTLEEATANAKEAILFHIEGALEDNQNPEVIPFVLDDLKANPDYQEALFVAVDIDISDYTLKPERFNVSWPKYLLNKVDRYVQEHHDNRSNFLAKAVLEKLNQSEHSQ